MSLAIVGFCLVLESEQQRFKCFHAFIKLIIPKNNKYKKGSFSSKKSTKTTKNSTISKLREN